MVKRTRGHANTCLTEHVNNRPYDVEKEK